MSTETALFQIVHRVEQSFKYKEIALGAFLDFEGAFDNTCFEEIIKVARERGPVAGGSDPCLKADSCILPLWAAV